MNRINYILINIIITFLIFSFINWDFNPANWHWIVRTICSVFVLIYVEMHPLFHPNTNESDEEDSESDEEDSVDVMES
jgi:hypothetical protein